MIEERGGQRGREGGLSLSHSLSRSNFLSRSHTSTFARNTLSLFCCSALVGEERGLMRSTLFLWEEWAAFLLREKRKHKRIQKRARAQTRSAPSPGGLAAAAALARRRMAARARGPGGLRKRGGKTALLPSAAQEGRGIDGASRRERTAKQLRGGKGSKKGGGG